MNNQINDLLRELKVLMSLENHQTIDDEKSNRIAEKVYDYALTYIALGHSPVEALVELKTLPKHESLNVWRERATGALEMYRCMAGKKSMSASNELEIQSSTKPLEPGGQQLPLSHDTPPLNVSQPVTDTSKETEDIVQEFIPGDIDL